MLSKVVCSRCKHESIAFDNMWDLALGFNDSDGGKIKKMISNFLKEEVIADDYYCSKCKCKAYQLGRF
jgi:ubiquitin C-terminal hydrolase